MPLSRRFVILGLLIALAAFAFAVPAGAPAQSAGDEQYVDPFQGGDGNGGGNGGGGGNSGSDGTAQPDTGSGTTGGDAGSGSTSGDTGTTTDSTTAGTEAATGTDAGDGSALPATGLPVAVMVGAGLLLVGGGFTLRRRA